MGEIGGVYLPGFRKIEDGRRLVYKFVDVVGRGRKANFGEPFKQGAGTLEIVAIRLYVAMGDR